MPVQDTNEGIRLALFTDWGNVWGAGENMSVNDMRTAVGFGIRFPIMIPVALGWFMLLALLRVGSDHGWTRLHKTTVGVMALGVLAAAGGLLMLATSVSARNREREGAMF